MRIVVTGAAGFVGSHVCDQLLAAGHAVVGIDAFIDYYSREQKERNLEAARADGGFTLHELDLRTAELADRFDGVDAVIHEAALPGLPRSWVDVETYTSCNLVGTQRVLEACRVAGVPRVLHISTSSVYGSNAVGDERMPTRPVSPYGVTKLAAEHLVLAYAATFGLDVSILRYFSIYGPRQRPDMAYHLFIDAMLDGRPITVFGDGSQSRSNTFVRDCARGTVLALQGARSGEIYNIGGGEIITLASAITTIAELIGIEPDIRYDTARPGDQRHTAADTEKARRAFGYEPTIVASDGLREQLEWQVHLRAGAFPNPSVAEQPPQSR
jgi:nucleoside-diphosphate-sugar epimerase